MNTFIAAMTKFVILAVVTVACVSATYQRPYYPTQNQYQAPAPVYNPAPQQKYYTGEFINISG